MHCMVFKVDGRYPDDWTEEAYLIHLETRRCLCGLYVSLQMSSTLIQRLKE